MLFNLTNHINQSFIKRMYRKIVGTKSVHCRYTVSGISGQSLKVKSPNTVCIKAFFAGSTRLELATSCVTGRRSNQLNYDPDYIKRPSFLISFKKLKFNYFSPSGVLTNPSRFVGTRPRLRSARRAEQSTPTYLMNFFKKEIQIYANTTLKSTLKYEKILLLLSE